MNDIQQFLESIRKYDAGKCTLGEVRKYYERLNMFHEFEHYLSDADIRENDPQYAEMQNNELIKFISAIDEKIMKQHKLSPFLTIVAYNTALKGTRKSRAPFS